MEYKVLGISSGLGVSLYPFRKNLMGNIEARGIFHTPKNEQWELNFKDKPLWKSAPIAYRDISPRVDIVIGSPDCGSGSIFRLSRAKVYGNHKENDSLTLFIEGVNKYKPKLFLFENLDALFKSYPEDDFNAAFKHYYLIKHVASVSAWGNSQLTRKRLVVVGIRKDLPYKKIRRYFKLPDYSNQIKTCEELYSDLKKEANGNVREPMSDVISIHARKRMVIEEIKSEWNNRLKGKKRWTVEGGNFKTAPGVYRNLNKEYPATARKANRQFDETGRMLTPRQLARIQGVPDSFEIYIDKNKLNYWINKGRTVVTKTPPYEISVWFKTQLKKSYTLWNLKRLKEI